ncbi:MAG: hypothetical protein M1826_001855 [Phylliscum demangeonii]|nr:MAG: hypothetical protein M1826_001855 [Phylliscum demangeonii]
MVSSSLRAALVVLPAVAWALVVPEAHSSSGLRKATKITRSAPVVASIIDAGRPSHARFNVDCPHCVRDEKGRRQPLSFEFELAALASHDSCGFGNLTVNDHVLPQQAAWRSSHGQGLVSASGIDGGVGHRLGAEWRFSCLQLTAEAPDRASADVGQTRWAQYLYFVIREVDGRPLTADLGFSLSYFQTQDPQLLRLETTPHPVPGPDSVADWFVRPSGNDAHPTQHDRERTRQPASAPALAATAAAASSSISSSPSRSFEDDLRELRRLKSERRQIRAAIQQQKTIIWRHLKAEVQALRQEISRCDGFVCAFDATAWKVQAGMSLLCGDKSASVAAAAASDSDGVEPEAVAGAPPRWRSWFWNLPWIRPSLRTAHAPPCRAVGPSPPSPQAGLSSSSSSSGPLPDPHGCPPSVAPPTPDVTMPGHRLPQEPSPRHGWNPTAPKPPRGFLLVVLAHLFTAAGVPICILIFLLHRCVARRHRRHRQRRSLSSSSSSSSPSSSSSLMSRHTARVVRRAIQRPGLRQRWRNLWRDPRILEYEEKRTLIAAQEQILEMAMQHEIHQLRTAAEAVSSIVGVRRDYYLPPSTIGPLSRRNSLPDYRSEASDPDPPPLYDDDDPEGGAAPVVADGFQYTPTSGAGSYYPSSSSNHTTTTTTTTWTPDSSVVGTSVRGDLSSEDEDEHEHEHEHEREHERELEPDGCRD